MTEEREGVTVDRLLWRGKTAASVRLRIEATGPDARERLVAACTTIRAELNAIGATEYEAELVPARSESPADASQENAIMDGPHG